MDEMPRTRAVCGCDRGRPIMRRPSSVRFPSRSGAAVVQSFSRCGGWILPRLVGRSCSRVPRSSWRLGDAVRRAGPGDYAPTVLLVVESVRGVPEGQRDSHRASPSAQHRDHTPSGLVGSARPEGAPAPAGEPSMTSPRNHHLAKATAMSTNHSLVRRAHQHAWSPGPGRVASPVCSALPSLATEWYHARGGRHLDGHSQYKAELRTVTYATPFGLQIVLLTEIRATLSKR